MASPGAGMRALVLVFHLLCVIMYGFGEYYDRTVVFKKRKKRIVMGRYQFLTILNLMLQLVYHCVALVNDLFGTVETDPAKRGNLQKLRDLIMNSLAFPLGVFVPLMFWSLYAYDREVIFPAALDAIIPAWLNHIMHTWMLPLNIIEKCLTYHHYGGWVATHLTTMSAFTAGYIAWIHYIAHVSGVWVYPFLALLTAEWRVLFLVGATLLIVPLYYKGKIITEAAWHGRTDTAAASASAARDRPQSKKRR